MPVTARDDAIRKISRAPPVGEVWDLTHRSRHEMRIVHVITGLGIGGAESMLLQLIKASDRSKLKHVVLTLSAANAMVPEFEALGITVMNLRAAGLGSLTAFFRARKLIKAFGPDVLMTWLHHSDLFGVMLRVAMPSLPLVWNIRCSKLSLDELPWRNLVIVRVLAWLSWIPSIIVANSVAGKREHIAVGYRAARWRVLPNGFDTKRFTLNRDTGLKVRTASGIPMDGFVIGLVGRYHPMKGFDLFIRIAGRLAKTSRVAHFVLVGTDVDATNAELRDLIAAAELEGRVTLLGQRTDIADVMNAFDVIACTSTSEGFSNVIGEAMSCGVPCVATDVGDNATLVGPGGSIVAAGDADALLTELIRMVEMPPELFQELKIRARTHILKNFAIEDVAYRYEKLFNEFPIRTK